MCKKIGFIARFFIETILQTFRHPAPRPEDPADQDAAFYIQRFRQLLSALFAKRKAHQQF
jgi:hypothetical protein